MSYQGEVFGIAVDRNRSIYATGQSSDGNDGDYLTIKYDSVGSQKWAMTYDGPGHHIDQPTAIAVDALGNVFVTGHVWIASYDEDYATAKYDSAGTQKWIVRYDGVVHGIDHANALALDSSGNTIVAGYYTHASNDYDFMTVKYDSGGNQVWAVPYEGPSGGFDQACAVAVGESNSVYVAGTSTGSGTEYDIVLVMYDSTGDQKWVGRYASPGPYRDKAYALALDGSGGVYVSGSSDDADGGHFALVRFNAQGHVAWARRVLSGCASAIVADTSGDAYVTGLFYDGANPYTLVQKYDTSGDEKWSAYLGSAQPSQIALGPGGGVFVTRKVYSYYEHGMYWYDYLTTRLSQVSGVIEQRNNQPRAGIDVLCNPNPCQGSATIGYSLAASSPVLLTVSDVSGRVVRTLVHQQQSAGEYSARWNGLADSGLLLPGGIYICRLVANSGTSTRKVLLLRNR